MDLTQYAAPAATVAVAVISAIAARLTATRKTRDVQHLKLLIETTKNTDATTPEGKALRAQLLYEVEFYAAKNSGRDRTTHVVNLVMVVLAAVSAGYFFWLTYDSLGEDGINYATRGILLLPAIASTIVALVYGGRVDRIAKERKVRKKRDDTLKAIEEEAGQRSLLKRLRVPDSEIERLMAHREPGPAAS